MNLEIQIHFDTSKIKMIRNVTIIFFLCLRILLRSLLNSNSNIYLLQVFLSYGEERKKHSCTIIFVWYFGLQIYIKIIISRYNEITERFFFKYYSFYYIKNRKVHENYSRFSKLLWFFKFSVFCYLRKKKIIFKLHTKFIFQSFHYDLSRLHLGSIYLFLNTHKKTVHVFV